MDPTRLGVKSPVRTSPRIDYQFRPLPCETASSREVSQSAKLLHAVLLDAARRGGTCALTNRSMGARIGRSRATVKRLLAELESAGLARRELASGGRVRSAVVPFAPGVAHSQSTIQTTVAHSRAGGGSLSSPGVAHSCAASIQSPLQSALSDADRSSLGESEDAAALASPGPEGAAYLRACVDAVKRGLPAPEPPWSLAAGRSPEAPSPTAADSPVASDDKAPRNAPAAPVTASRAPQAKPTPATASQLPSGTPAAPRGMTTPPPPRSRRPAPASAGGMVRSLAETLKSPDVGRRWFPAVNEPNRAARRAEAAILRGRA